ncbi:MAG: arginine--tRNA ligase [Myxococcota bacterium]
MRLEAHLEQLVAQVVLDLLPAEEHGNQVRALVRPTQNQEHGDYQVNGMIPLAKRLRRPPLEMAAPVAEALRERPEFLSAEVAGPGFINLRLDAAWMARLLNEDLGDPRLGVPEVETPKSIVVDYSSPNIAKQMHVGHIRSTVIGDSVSRTLRFVGHRVTRDNHLGDWGTQFGLLLVGMRAFGDETALAKNAIVELERVYRLASARAKEDDTFAAAAREELAKLQAGDSDNLALWKRFVATTREVLEEMYARLDVEFDIWLGESTYNSMLGDVVALLIDRGLAREDDGAVGIFWNEVDAPKSLRNQKEPFLVRKRDGAYLYATSDIATALHRQDQLQAEESIYVVDSRQTLHFRQLFAVAELLGVRTKMEHVSFGTVLDEHGQPLRTRDGQTVTLGSVLDEAERRAEERIRAGVAEGKIQLEPEAIVETARTIGIGAVKYADLRQNRTSDYRFDWDKLISFSGDAGPYVQYAYARTRSILQKGNRTEEEASEGTIDLAHEAELALGRILLIFGDTVHKAAETRQPHLLCQHAYELATQISRFLTQCRVLQPGHTESERARFALLSLAGRQLRCALNLLGIHVVERM